MIRECNAWLPSIEKKISVNAFHVAISGGEVLSKWIGLFNCDFMHCMLEGKGVHLYLCNCRQGYWINKKFEC